MARQMFPLARPRNWALVAALTVTLMGIAWWRIEGETVLDVPADYASIASALEAAPEGAVIELAPGVYEESPVIERPVTIVGPSVGQAEIRGERSGPTILVQGTRDVVLRHLTISNGKVGVLVRDSEDVLVADSVIVDNVLRGVHVVYASAHVLGNVVRDASSPLGIGIHVANAMSWPRSVIAGNLVARSGAAGIATNMARVLIRNNHVSGTSLQAIAVTEMSEGLVEGNRVTGVAGVGLYCGDMSHCEFTGNTVRGVAPAASAGRSHGGYGAVALYHATMRLRGNTFERVGAPEPVGTYLDSTVTDRFPLAFWPPGWRGALPGIAVAGVGLGVLVAVRFAIGPWLRRRGRKLERGGVPEGRPFPQGTLAVLIGGLAVQSFHMLEHAVQVYQVYVADAERRSGLLGAVADTEWVHFVYNVAVMVFLALVFRIVWSGAGGWRAIVAGAGAFLAAATLVQGYHVVEHVTKMVQHILWGFDPAPGLVGGRLGLVWFHFGINLAVYAGFAIAVGLLPARRMAELSAGDGARPVRAAADLA